MKKKDFPLAVKRFANFWYCCDPIELKEKLALWTNLALTIDDGIFKKDSAARCSLVNFTEKLPVLVDAMYLVHLDTGGKGNKKKGIIKATKLTQKQINYPMLYALDFFVAFKKRIARNHLWLWLETLIDVETQISNPLEKNEIFPFFLFLHEFVEVSHLMLKYLMSLEKDNEKEKKED